MKAQQISLLMIRKLIFIGILVALFSLLSLQVAMSQDMLRNFATSKAITYKFYFDENEKRNRLDGFKRYGTNVGGICKQLQRRNSMSPRSVAIKE